VILHNSSLLFLARDQVIFKQGDLTEERSYLVLHGSIDLKGFVGPEQKFETLGTCSLGDTFGEEGVFELGKTYRKETGLADEDSYLLELTKSQYAIIQAKLQERGLAMEWFTLNNCMKSEWIKKRSWRMRKD
jgi:CRP-like cAMP-binding protein